MVPLVKSTLFRPNSKLPLTHYISLFAPPGRVYLHMANENAPSSLTAAVLQPPHFYISENIGSLYNFRKGRDFCKTLRCGAVQGVAAQRAQTYQTDRQTSEQRTTKKYAVDEGFAKGSGRLKPTRTRKPCLHLLLPTPF